MSHPHFGPDASASGAWPYGSPDQRPGYDPGDDTEPYQKMHHADAVPDDPGAGAIPQDSGLPPDWPGYGAYTPGPDDQSSWNDPPRPAPSALPPYSRRRQRPLKRAILLRMLLLAVVAAGAGAALLHTGAIHLTPASHHGSSATSGPGGAAGTGTRTGESRSSAPQPPVISKAEAERVVTRYRQVNNQANETYSNSLLRSIEAGSSYSMDTGAYRFALGSTNRTPYTAFKLTNTRYYIPRLPHTTYPRWFVIRGSIVTLSTGKNLGSTYIVFAQGKPGAPWKDVTEPDILPGRALPQVATGSGGYAESVAANDAGLSVAPDKIGQVTATWLNQVASSMSDTAVLANAGNLTDLKDEVFWRSGEGGATFDATDTHSVAANPVFALKTTSGGALMFYTVAAHLVLTPPNGGTISALNIPGYYSPSSSAGLASAAVGYIDQFATYVPPAGRSGRKIVANMASIASRG